MQSREQLTHSAKYLLYFLSVSKDCTVTTLLQIIIYTTVEVTG